MTRHSGSCSRVTGESAAARRAIITGEAMRADTLADVIGSLYDCVLEPERWSQALPLISSLGASTASSIVVNDRSGAGAAHIFEHGADQSYLRLYFEKLAATKALPAKTTVLDR